MRSGPPDPGQENRYLGAASRRWPDGRPLCGAETRAEGSSPTCRKTAGEGTDHYGAGRCKRHLGATANHTKHAQKLLAAQAVATYGIRSDLPTGEALLEEAQWSHGHAVWLRGVIQMIDPDALTWGVVEETEKGATEFPGVDVKKMAAPSVWLDLYHKERRLHLDQAKTVETLRLEQRRDDQIRRNGEVLKVLLLGLLRRNGVEVSDPAALEAMVVEELEALVGPVRREIEGSAA